MPLLSSVEGTDQNSRGAHRALTIQQKRELCHLKDQDPRMTQARLIQYAKATFGIIPSMTSINRMIHNKDKFIGMQHAPSAKKRDRGAKWPALEAELETWIEQMKEQDLCLLDRDIIAKAKEVADQLMIGPFSASSGWLAKFKQRHSIDVSTAQRKDNATSSSSGMSLLVTDGTARETIEREQSLVFKKSEEVVPEDIALGIPAPTHFTPLTAAPASHFGTHSASSEEQVHAWSPSGPKPTMTAQDVLYMGNFTGLQWPSRDSSSAAMRQESIITNVD